MDDDKISSMGRDAFVGSPKITSPKNAADLQPRSYPFLDEVDHEDFPVEGLTAKYHPEGATVYDGGEPVASYNFGDTLVVHPKYRKKGIGEELVYQWRTRFPGPAKATHRTKASQRIQEKVWDRIVREGKAEGGGLTAYHGSPHDFDEFDVSKIGTGEGAQMYGHGLYQAENPEVARGYRDSVMQAQGGYADMRIGSTPIEDYYARLENRLASMPAHQAEQGYNRLALLEDLMHGGDELHIRDNAKQGAYDPAAMEWFEKEIAPKFKRQGRLYEVHIDAHPDHFLDWDKPLSEQSDHVKSAFIKAQTGGDPELEGLFDLSPESLMIQGMVPDVKGSGAYKTLESDHGSAAAATKKLSEAGIRGIRYRDAGSRGDSGEPTHNYVVFDHSHVKVRRKYEKGGSVEPEYHQTPEFQNWFGDSVAHQNGVPITYYHGTSKDVDFPSFKVGNHGVWLTSNPEEASSYAAENDSQNFKYEGGKYVRTNTASRVIPVHLKAENPYRGEKPEEILQKQNYKKAQSDWFAQLRAQGYDSWIPDSQGGALAVALKDPTQIKSIYNRTFDPKNKRMDKAAGGQANPAVNKAIHVISKTGSSPREAVTLSKRLLGRQ